MLELRPTCENCDRPLPPDSLDAMICSYECTFCLSCVTEILENVCPNCGGGFEKRPIRPKKELDQNPSTTTRVYKPVNLNSFQVLKEKMININPKDR